MGASPVDSIYQLDNEPLSTSIVIKLGCLFYPSQTTLTSDFSELLWPFGQFYFLDVHLHSKASPSRGGVGATIRLGSKHSSPPLTDTTCVEDCPEGYYAKDSHLCAPCHISCRTCDGRHSMQCRSCRPGWFQLENECLLQCREG